RLVEPWTDRARGCRRRATDRSPGAPARNMADRGRAGMERLGGGYHAPCLSAPPRPGVDGGTDRTETAPGPRARPCSPRTATGSGAAQPGRQPLGKPELRTPPESPLENAV